MKNNEPLIVAQVMGKWVGGGLEAMIMNYYRNNISYREINDYMERVHLSPVEAYFVTRIEGSGHKNRGRRNNDPDFVYFAVNFVKRLSSEGRLEELSEEFLDRFLDYSVTYLNDLVDICFFKDDINNYVFMRYIEVFYEFFVQEYDYGNHKYEVIKNYLKDDSDNILVIYKTLMAIDLNLLIDSAGELALVLEHADVYDLKKFIKDNDMVIDGLSKKDFNKQLEYINEKYLSRKYMTRKKVLKRDN